MQLDYRQAQRLEGKMIEFKNKKGEWAIGRVVKVKKDGLEIKELGSSIPNSGYGFGFGPGPFFGPPVFFPFVGFGFFSPFFF